MAKAPEARKETKTVDMSDEDVQKALQTAVDGLKGKADKTQVVNMLRTVADLLNRDTWSDDAATPDDVPDEDDKPKK